MFAGLVKALETIEHPALALLAKCYLEDEALIEKFKRAPAAMTLHHAYIGGLLEHTLSLMRLGHVVCPLYPGVNREIVMLGLFLHDLGKCVELTWDAGFGYSDEGMLVGHIARGVIWLEEKAKECEAKGTKVPEPLLRVLHHIILSHHGKAEFGALKVPATPEALAISLMDNLDAKMHMALAVTRDDAGEAINRDGNFTERIWALDTRMYRPDPTKLDESE
jgi:3'-5' exoribonuclease